MKRIKTFYKEHRVFTILMAVVIVCLVLIATVLINCFYVNGDMDKYGSRLEGIEAVKIGDKRINKVESQIMAESKVKVAKVKLTGKIIYLEISFENDASLDEAKSVGQKTLEFFEKDELAYYDFHFTLKQTKSEANDGFLISGAKNKNGSGLVWNNNNPVTIKEDSEGK